MKLLLVLAMAAALELAEGAADSPCVAACPEVYSPVCASDGVSYDNDCFFEYTKCMLQSTTLTVVANGTCDSSTSDSGSQSASSSSASASSGSCAEEFACLEIYDPVCGSDGQTYSSDCFLKLAHCADSSITQTHAGECGSGSGSVSVSSGDAGDSVSMSGSCSSVCTREYEPVCGSDGVTYSNNCTFANAQCVNTTLSVASDGACNSTDASSAGSGSTSSGALVFSFGYLASALGGLAALFM